MELHIVMFRTAEAFICQVRTGGFVCVYQGELGVNPEIYTVLIIA